MKSQKKNCHTGHRKRLRDLTSRVGLKNLTDVQIVEQLLFYTNARKDTNEIAHNLLNQFGSISRILDATESELTHVAGVGEITAKFINYVAELFEIYHEQKNSSERVIRNLGDVHRLIYPYFAGEKDECIYIAYIDKTDRLTTCEKLSEGNKREVSVSPSTILDKLLKRSERKCIVAHNHPHGSVNPSAQDYETYCELTSTLTQLGFTLADCIIVGEDKYYSMKNSMVVHKDTE